jgi:hypothetical protein
LYPSWDWSKDKYKSCHFAAQNETTKVISLFLYKRKPQKHQSSQANHSSGGFLVFFEAFFGASPSFLVLTALGRAGPEILGAQGKIEK